jgi:hypothetical protein
MKVNFLKHTSHFWLYLSKSTSGFIGANFAKNIIVKGIFCLNIPYFAKDHQISKENYLKKFHHIFKYSDLATFGYESRNLLKSFYIMATYLRIFGSFKKKLLASFCFFFKEIFDIIIIII